MGYIAPAYEKAGYEITKAMYTFSHGASQEVGRRVIKELLAKFPEIEKEYTGLKVLAWTSGVNYQLLTTKKPVRKISDLKGMRIKCVGELMDALKDLGAEGIIDPHDRSVPVDAERDIGRRFCTPGNPQIHEFRGNREILYNI